MAESPQSCPVPARTVQRHPWVSRALTILVAIVLVGGAEAARAEADPAADVRAQIRATWGRLAAFECQSDQRTEPASGEEPTRTHVDFSWRSDGRSRYHMVRDVDGETHEQDTREDGRRRVQARQFPTPPRVVDEIRIDAPISKPGLYEGLGFLGLSILMPLGRNLAGCLEDGAMLENRGSTESPRWTLTVTRKEDRAECDLDVAHQFLPRMMTLTRNQRTYRIRVERFAEADGFSYPAEGSATYGATEKLPELEVHFQLDEVRFNPEIPESRFQWTTFPTGVRVTNKIDGKTYDVGGRAARLQLLRQHPASTKGPIPTGPAITAPADPDAAGRRWFVAIVLGIAVVSAIGGAILWRRCA